MNIRKIDATGKPCPIPVIEAKKAIRELEETGGIVEITVDNETAVQNIEKMALSLNVGMESSVGKEANITVFSITLTVLPKQEEKQNSCADNDFVIAVGKGKMGEGNEELGAILLKSYFYALTELENSPSHMMFFNGGAFLTQKSSNVLKDLKCLEEKGTHICTCGTCLDFYQIKEGLGIGKVSNMFEIAEIMEKAGKVIHL